MKTKHTYFPPSAEVTEMAVEAGFAASAQQVKARPKTSQNLG